MSIEPTSPAAEPRSSAPRWSLIKENSQQFGAAPLRWNWSRIPIISTNRTSNHQVSPVFYQQDDRDARKDRPSRRSGKAYNFMVRCKIPGGRVSADQYPRRGRPGKQVRLRYSAHHHPPGLSTAPAFSRRTSGDHCRHQTAAADHPGACAMWNVTSWPAAPIRHPFTGNFRNRRYDRPAPGPAYPCLSMSSGSTGKQFK